MTFALKDKCTIPRQSLFSQRVLRTHSHSQVTYNFWNNSLRKYLPFIFLREDKSQPLCLFLNLRRAGFFLPSGDNVSFVTLASPCVV